MIAIHRASAMNDQGPQHSPLEVGQPLCRTVNLFRVGNLDVRIVDRQTQSIGVLWQTEQPVLRPLPGRPFDCCVTRQVHLTPYSQITYEINRYSAPVEQARRELVLKAYPFHIEILSEHRVLA